VLGWIMLCRVVSFQFQRKANRVTRPVHVSLTCMLLASTLSVWENSA
jgi:hypothetical protein